MLRAHSLLWNYLWLAPDLLQVGLAFFIFRRGLHKLFPAFFAYTIYEAVKTFTLYAMDVIPSVSGEAYWGALWVGLIIEGLVKFAVMAELMRRLLRSRPALAKTGNLLFTCAGAGLVLLAAAAAAYVTPHNPNWLVEGGRVLVRSLYIVQCGLILFVFVFAGFFRVTWDRLSFGIALGFGIVFCEHLAGWAIMAVLAFSNRFVLLDFLNMATYHFCVLIWCYYLLVPVKRSTTSAVSLPENNLAIWNRELERLLQQ